MSTRSELLQAAAARRLVSLVDVVARDHVVWLEPDHSAPQASQADSRRVHALVAEGLVQLGDKLVSVPWYGDSTALGQRFLPTEAGLALLERLRDQAALATAAAAIGGAA